MLQIGSIKSVKLKNDKMTGGRISTVDDYKMIKIIKK